MKLSREIIIIILLAIVLAPLSGQQDSVLTLSISQAKDLALQNNDSIKNARLDVLQSKRRVWETTAMGLPHADVAGSYQHMPNLPEMFNMFLYDPLLSPAEQLQIYEDAKTTSTYDITVSQLVFSGAYIVGLQTAKIYKSLSNLALQLTERSVIENVTNSYYLVLITKENVAILDSSLHNTQKVYEELTSVYEQGLIDQTDVDQLKIVVQTIQNSLLMIKRQSEIIERLLKFQLGIDLNTRIRLTDDINMLIASMNFESALGMEFNLNNDLTYQLLQTQEDLTKQALRLQKSEFLPNVSAFYRYHKNLNEKAFDLQPKDLLGVSVSIPLFSSGERIAKVSRAKIELKKARNSNEQAARGLLLGFEQSKSNYLGALEKMELTKDNMELSKRIYDRTLTKFSEGMASNADIIQAQNQYLENQGTYYSTIIELVGAKLKLDKALNNF